jgi:hypothetical protein
MKPACKLRVLSESELRRLTIKRLLAYRKKALSLENTLSDSDYHDAVEELETTFIWFKDDPRWQALYERILTELARRRSEKASRE